MSLMRRLSAALAALGLSCGAHALPVNWANWTAGTVGANGTATGSFNTATGNVNISYNGELAFIETGTGTNYFNPSTPYVSALVDNPPPAAEMLALSVAASKTMSFSQAVDNLFFAIVSLNGNGYRFNSDFEIVSTGQGFWGNGTLTKVNLGGGQFQLNGTGEPHGVIRFTGSVSSITWTSLTNEFWNGITVGTYGIATEVPTTPPVTPIPEPETYALMLAGLALLGRVARRQKR